MQQKTILLLESLMSHLAIQIGRYLLLNGKFLIKILLIMEVKTIIVFVIIMLIL